MRVGIVIYLGVLGFIIFLALILPGGISKGDRETQCNDGEVLGLLNGKWDCLNITTASTTFYPYTVNVTQGTYISGNVSAITNYDNIILNVSESTGSNPLEIKVNFTNVTGISYILLRERHYAAGTNHQISLYLYDYNASRWESYYSISDQSDFNTNIIPVADEDDHILNGDVQILFNHTTTPGQSAHFFYIDFIQLIKGTSATITNEHDALTGRNNESNHPWAASMAFVENNFIQNDTRREYKIHIGNSGILSDVNGFNIDNLASGDIIKMRANTSGVMKDYITLKPANNSILIGNGTGGDVRNVFWYGNIFGTGIYDTTGFYLDNGANVPSFGAWLDSMNLGIRSRSFGYSQQLVGLTTNGAVFYSRYNDNNVSYSTTGATFISINSTGSLKSWFTIAPPSTATNDLRFSRSVPSALNYLEFVYNASEIRIPTNNLELIFGASNNAGIKYDGTNLIFTTNKTGNGIAWFSSNISAENVIDRSWFWDAAIGESLDYVKDASELTTGDTALFPFERTTYKVTDFERPVIINEINERCEINTSIGYVCVNVSEKKTIYPFTKDETGRIISVTVGKHEQNIYDLKEEIARIKLCAADSATYELYRNCVGGVVI